jgi:hypothetical protein
MSEKPYAEYPLLSKHCETCPICANPISEQGEEQGMCEKGFECFQKDLENASK